MLLLAALLSLAPPESPAARAQAIAPAIVILGNDGSRARVARVLGDLAAAGQSLRQEDAGGLWYVGCVTAWRENPQQSESCIRARLPRQRERATILLNTYGPGTRQGGTIAVSCVGLGGTGGALLPERPEAGDAAAMLGCLNQALQANTAPFPHAYGVQSSTRFAMEDVEQARTTATTVLRIAIDHVGYPRGMTGSCLVQGRVAAVERGPALRPGGAIEVFGPCGPDSRLDGERRVRMAGMGAGGFALVYLNSLRTLLHIEQAGQ
jgi:hypothetical protein